MLKELIDKFYLDREKVRNHKDQIRFYITDAGRCPRAVFFKLKKAPKEELEARVLRMFEHGDYFHQIIMKPLFAVKEVRIISAEVDIPPQEIISGRADAIISDGKDLYVLDIKSMNSMIFKNLSEPKEENINQLQLYLHFFKVPKGILLYVNKDTQELKEFIVNYSQNIAKNLLNDLAGLKTKIDSNIIPSRIPIWPDGWQCQYCAFREICNTAGEGDINWNNFRKKIESQEVESS